MGMGVGMAGMGGGVGVGGLVAPPLPPDLEEAFLRDGYVVIPGAWSNVEVR
jgi:hypothetical protein